jgi:hypothetical protein
MKELGRRSVRGGPQTFRFRDGLVPFVRNVQNIGESPKGMFEADASYL